MTAVDTPAPRLDPATAVAVERRVEVAKEPPAKEVRSAIGASCHTEM